MTHTGPLDNRLSEEAMVMYRSVRRQIPPSERRQARAEFKIRYLFSMIYLVPEELFHYGRVFTAVSLSKLHWSMGRHESSTYWRHRSYVYSVALVRYSLNITAYQCGCFSARWGLFINVVSRVGSRAFLSYYNLCHRFGFLDSEATRFRPIVNLESLAMSMWTRALCIIRIVKLAFGWSMHRAEMYFGKDIESKLWDRTWRLATCQLLESKLNISFWEVSMVSPELSKRLLFPLSQTVRLLVEHRLLRSPWARW